MREIADEFFPQFKRVGREYHGPCFRCGGEDRFIVWLAQGNQGLFRVWCRQCSYTNDALGFVMDSEGLGWRDAHDRLGISMPDADLTPEDMARRALENQIALRRSRAPAEITEASRVEALVDLYHDATNDDLVRYLVEGWNRNDRAQYRSALTHIAGRLRFALSFFAHERQRRPKAVETLLLSISGYGSAREIYDALGMDQATLDQIDRIGFFEMGADRGPKDETESPAG